MHWVNGLASHPVEFLMEIFVPAWLVQVRQAMHYGGDLIVPTELLHSRAEETKGASIQGDVFGTTSSIIKLRNTCATSDLSASDSSDSH
jgi:hypothetical protein